MITKQHVAGFPSTFGVYFFKRGQEVLYVGKSVNIKARVISHIENAKVDRKESLIISNSDRVEYEVTENELKALLLESQLIQKLHPKYNVIWRDNKSYLYIKITVKEEYPKVLLSRRPPKSDKRARYFGPFSGMRVAQEIISDIRHIVPFCTQKNLSPRPCFHSKISLCDPCPNGITRIEEDVKRHGERIRYRKNIGKVIRILEGKVQTIVADFYHRLKTLIKQEKYEEAIAMRNKIFRLERLIHYPLSHSDFYSIPPQDYEKSLRQLLNPYFPNIKNFLRIETYDISNLGEKNQTASMVVAIRGQIDKSQYRRFKIKTPAKSDFERLEEVIKRRFSKPMDMPSLVIIDGGEPQVARVMRVVGEMKATVPVVGIAKNPDRLVVGVAGFPTIRPAIRNTGFNLIRALRDESHRFARKYHLYLRGRDFLI